MAGRCNGPSYWRAGLAGEVGPQVYRISSFGFRISASVRGVCERLRETIFPNCQSRKHFRQKKFVSPCFQRETNFGYMATMHRYHFRCPFLTRANSASRAGTTLSLWFSLKKAMACSYILMQYGLGLLPRLPGIVGKTSR